MRPCRRLSCRIASLALVVGLVASGCGSSSDSSTDGDPDSPSTPATDAPPSPEEALVGRYAHYDVVAYQDEAMKTLIISTGFADLEMRDGQLWNRMRFCHADVGSDQGLEISISDAATSAIVPVDTPVTVTEVDGVVAVNRPPTPTPIGIKMADPANEVLPDDPKDPRIFDADGDGNPGVTSTVKVSDELEAEIYLARREIFEYDVVQETPDRLVGSITDSSEQLIIGASNPLFVAEAQWKQVKDPSRNPVIWQRVGDDWDCKRLAKERPKIFPPKPKVDW